MKREDIVTYPVSEAMLKRAKDWAVKLDRERQGSKTMEGGKEKNVKGCLAQEAVHETLNKMFWPHEYLDPYQENLPKDEFDIRVAEETWDVKCRGFWNEEYFYNLKLLVGEHERDLKCDYYVFCTVDEEYKNVYILGAVSYDELWDNLHEPKNALYKFPPAGFIYSRELKPFKPFVVRV